MMAIMAIIFIIMAQKMRMMGIKDENGEFENDDKATGIPNCPTVSPFNPTPHLTFPCLDIWWGQWWLDKYDDYEDDHAKENEDFT